MKRTKEEAAMTRQSVLDSALRVISRKGYAQTTLGEIAKVAGVTRGAIYWHFRNKFEILQAVINKLYLKTKRKLDEIKGSDLDPINKIHFLIKEMVLMISNKEQFGIIEELELFKNEKDDELRGIYEFRLRMIGEIKDTISSILEKGVKAGQMPPRLDIKVTVTAILSYIGGIKSAGFSGPLDMTIQENADKLAKIFINGISGEHHHIFHGQTSHLTN